MTVNVLSQELAPDIDNSVGAALIKYSSIDEYCRFTAIPAFASEAGVNGLSLHINRAKQTYQNLTIIVGIDQKGTSKEALDALLARQITVER